MVSVLFELVLPRVTQASTSFVDTGHFYLILVQCKYDEDAVRAVTRDPHPVHHVLHALHDQAITRHTSSRTGTHTSQQRITAMLLRCKSHLAHFRARTTTHTSSQQETTAHLTESDCSKPVPRPGINSSVQEPPNTRLLSKRSTSQLKERNYNKPVPRPGITTSSSGQKKPGDLFTS